jgi:hypothetical protein
MAIGVVVLAILPLRLIVAILILMVLRERGNPGKSHSEDG